MTTKFTLRRVRINQGGYDDSGRYWGIGSPLYHYQADYPDTLTHWTWTDANRCGHPASPDKNMRCEWCGMGVRREDNTVSDHTRADNREHAKQIIRAKYPDAVFYR